MATWHATATDEDNAPAPTLWNKIFGKITGAWTIVVRVLIFCFLAWLFFLIMAALSEEKAETVQITVPEMEQEDRDAIITQEDYDFWDYTMKIVNGLDYGDFTLNNKIDNLAEEFGKAYFPESRNIVVKEITFHHEQKTVDVVYDLGVNKEVKFSFSNQNITKQMTRYEGFSEGGSFLRYIQWYTFGKYKKGYPCYTCSVDIENGTRYRPNGSKRIYRLQPFSMVRDLLQFVLKR